MARIKHNYILASKATQKVINILPFRSPQLEGYLYFRVDYCDFLLQEMARIFLFLFFQNFSIGRKKKS